MVDPDSGGVSRAPPYLGFRSQTFTISDTGLSPSPAGFPKTVLLSWTPSYRGPATPPKGRFRLLRFRSPLLPESLLISFPGVLRWFSSPSVASAPYIFRRGCRDRSRRVTPFGYRRITGCVLLPAAFRSWPRLSSPERAKASTCGPSSGLTILLFRQNSFKSCPCETLVILPRSFASRNSKAKPQVSPPFPLGGSFTPAFLSNICGDTSLYLISLEIRGLGPLTSSLQSWRSSQLSYIPDYCASSNIKKRDRGEGVCRANPGRRFGKFMCSFPKENCIANPREGVRTLSM